MSDFAAKPATPPEVRRMRAISEDERSGGEWDMVVVEEEDVEEMGGGEGTVPRLLVEKVNP